VAPVYQPEVAADAIHWAAHHRRCEVYVGIPTVYTIWGNRFAPWLAERYLSRTAVSGQLSDTDKAPGRRDNLFDTTPGDPGAHGPYDEHAHLRSIQLWATKRRRELLTGVLVASTAAGTRPCSPRSLSRPRAASMHAADRAYPAECARSCAAPPRPTDTS